MLELALSRVRKFCIFPQYFLKNLSVFLWGITLNMVIPVLFILFILPKEKLLNSCLKNPFVSVCACEYVCVCVCVSVSVCLSVSV